MTTPVQTTFTPTAVTNMANEHRDFASSLGSKMTVLQNDIQQTLAASNSAMTHALDSTYNEFRDEVNKVVVQTMNTMADEMMQALHGQQAGDQTATSGVATTGGNMGSFLGGA